MQSPTGRQRITEARAKLQALLAAFAPRKPETFTQRLERRIRDERRARGNKRR